MPSKITNGPMTIALLGMLAASGVVLACLISFGLGLLAGWLIFGVT